ncbi:OmpA family protein [Pseudohongiella spirulinae]|uniref:Outer membrane protein and related peptidoglycan-associated (Lipo)protein n=1 Tax=Pseudohongiella spirulinae TaxID=1249552 RepID=A0A0S2KE58_9GAMM|nr:OmpA family protein [Pseudohongiella spirulinae]ALO46356.1 Outer membrane protein and related peptidoglycan-associated (Lipo)protein [Pseudohongiella spirulinae]
MIIARPSDSIHPRICRALASLAGLMCAASVHAGSVSSYYPDFDASGWTTEGSIFECSLSQQIPGFGMAVFYHRAGEPLSFYLQTPDSPMQAGKALLTSQPPVWRQDLTVKDLAYVDVTRSRRPVSLDASHSRLLIAELGRGMVPTLMRRAWFSDNESVHVGLSPVRFGEAYQNYHACAAELLPVNFDQIERSTVFWPVNSRELDETQKAQLDDIITYIKADPRVLRAEINGFTDGAGNARDNLELSRIRAFAVQSYLVQNGLDENMFNTRFFGATPEFRIVREERSAEDRDRNRRVTIRLHRE